MDSKSKLSFFKTFYFVISYFFLKNKNSTATQIAHVKLCDFGVSRAVDDENLRTFVGEQVEGTILYMAPEMIGAKVFSQKCDVYSFGVCLWEALSRRAPFSGPEYEKMSRFQFDEAKAAGALPGDMPKNCTPRAKALIEACLAVSISYGLFEIFSVCLVCLVCLVCVLSVLSNSL